jgi:macrodomain Ter protein organizer (MatP/YcbG family)
MYAFGISFCATMTRGLVSRFRQRNCAKRCNFFRTNTLFTKKKSTIWRKEVANPPILLYRLQQSSSFNLFTVTLAPKQLQDDELQLLSDSHYECPGYRKKKCNGLYTDEEAQLVVDVSLYAKNALEITILASQTLRPKRHSHYNY